MFILIVFGVIAVIALIALTLFNMKAAAKLNDSNTPSEEKIEQKLLEVPKLEISAAQPVQENNGLKMNKEEKINDDAYRNALKSFQNEAKKTNVEQSSNKIKDDDFRKVLRSLSEKPKDTQ
ncbi:hypothetical protein [Neobacillus terrae]|uniref:hypothetical protein n=1 Tax=Neobacillus terrae TaxID=3034837 RepID=UPI0014073161|nr:hypothetical protein [Neobacillus terrae]NHM32554.1 hypothetical protein [Neobacillus terrae]